MSWFKDTGRKLRTWWEAAEEYWPWVARAAAALKLIKAARK